MAKSTSACNSILALLFNATPWANFADNAGSSPVTNLYVSLHQTDPGVGGSQLTGEANYDGYARKAIVRTTGGWAAPTGGSLSNAALAQFNECTGGSNTIQYVAIGKADTGQAGLVLYAGALNSPRTISAGIQPQFAPNALVVTET